MSIRVATRMIRAFLFIAYDFWDKDGTFFVNRVLIWQILARRFFHVLLFLALVSINPRQADSVSNYTRPEDDWTATILAFLSKGKSNFFW